MNIKNQKENFIDFVKSFKRLSKQYFSTNILFFTFVITSVVNGYLIRYFTVKNYFSIKPVIADLALVTIIGAFGYFFKPKHQFKYFFIWSLVFVIDCIINSVYYTNYLSFSSFSLIKTSGQAMGVGDAIQSLLEVKDFFYAYQLVALIFVHSFLKKKKYYDKVSKVEIGKVRALNTLVVGVIFIGLFISMLSSVDISRLGKQWNREYIVMQFGLYTYQANDLVATVKSELNPLFGYDKKAKVFREYYTTKVDISKKNKYTNIFKGKNIIAIHAESIQNFTLNTSFNGVDVAPNLKKLASEGLYFSNFYAQESVGTSSDTEFTYSSSLMPSSSGTVFVNYFDRDYVTMQKLLQGKDYYTFSMHGNNCSFWNRAAAHKSLGYDNFYCYKKDFTIDETIGLGLSDKSFFRQAIPIIDDIKDKNKNFYGTMIMLSNHTPFTGIEGKSDYEVTYKYKKYNEETKKYEEETAPYMEGTRLGSYFKSVHYADEALGQFIDDLDKQGLLDNTVIVIYGDHDAKLKKSEYNRFYNYDYETNKVLSKKDENYKPVNYYTYELNREVPFIIWTKDSKNNKLLNKEVTEVMGMIDILPTLGNMFGFKNKYALGNDMFSIEDNIVVFPDGNWLTNKMYYSQTKGEGKLLNPDETVSVDYINKNTKYAEELISISDSIIVYDMIKKVEESDKLVTSEEK